MGDSTMATNTTETSTQQDDRAYLTATFFSLFLGFLGVDRFYMGHVGLGILKLLTFGGLGIWWLIDFIWISLGNARTKSGKRLVRTEAATKIVYVGVGIFVLLQIVAGILGTITYESTLDSLDQSLDAFTETIQGATIEGSGSGNEDDGQGSFRITFPEK